MVQRQSKSNLPARSWIDTYCTVCMYVDFILECARARGDVTVALQWHYSGVTVTLQ